MRGGQRAAGSGQEHGVSLPAARRPLPARVAMLTPLPPARTGIAHYSSMLIPELSRRFDLQVFESLDGYRRSDFDAVIYQLGNNPHHEVMYRQAMREPGVIVLHEVVLHHLIVEMTLARGDVEGFVAALEANHGPAGAAWARARAAGMHTELANFLFPASIEVANRSKAVIVHNRYAAERLRSFGVTTPVHVVPHPYDVQETRSFDREAVRARLGFEPEHRVIGVFGFLTGAKRADVILEAFRRANDPRLRLLVVGEPAPNVTPPKGEGIVSTGYVSNEEFPSYYPAVDRVVNLRYPTAGEASGTLIRAFDFGKPAAVSNYAQFSEFPDDCVFKVPLGADEVERLVEFFTADLPDYSHAQRRWLEANARVDLAADGYVEALRGAEGVRAGVAGALPLFVQLQLRGTRLTNSGSQTIRTRTYGEPELRLIDGDRWLPLPCDLHPGQSVDVDVSATGPVYLALQGIPFVELERVR